MRVLAHGLPHPFPARLFQSQDHETHSKYLTWMFGGQMQIRTSGSVWITVLKATFVFFTECIFKGKESLDLKILWLSCCHSPDLWSGAAKLICSSPYNVELNRIRRSLCLISGDAKSLSANAALQSSWQKGRRNTNTLNITVYSLIYLGILIFPIMVFCGIGIWAYSRYPEYFDNPKYGLMVFNLWKDSAIQFRAITQMSFPVTLWLLVVLKLEGFIWLSLPLSTTTAPIALLAVLRSRW